MSAGTAEQATAPVHTGRSWSRAVGDLAFGWRQRRLWGHLGLQDIKQRYRRSVIGPLWITISMAMTATALGVLYSALFGQPLERFLPYLTVGLIIWNFVSGCINEGTEVFIHNEGLIKHLPAPLSVHVYRLVWRQLMFLGHNLLVYAVLLVIFPKPLDWGSLLAIPALALLAINAVWVSLLVGIVATRFRDIPPVSQSLVQLAFFLTPIVWDYEILRNVAGAAGERARLVELNPFMHFVEITRRPMLGETFEARHWLIVLAITVVGWTLALIVLRNYRARVPYWV